MHSTVAAALLLGLAACAAANDCVNVQSNLRHTPGNPTAKWLVITGVNKCFDAQDLSGKELSFDIKVKPSTVSGTPEFLPADGEFDYDNDKVSMTFQDGAVLQPSANFEITFGINKDSEDEQLDLSHMELDGTPAFMTWEVDWDAVRKYAISKGVKFPDM